jgi:hypothetical protein
MKKVNSILIGTIIACLWILTACSANSSLFSASSCKNWELALSPTLIMPVQEQKIIPVEKGWEPFALYGNGIPLLRRCTNT